MVELHPKMNHILNNALADLRIANAALYLAKNKHRNAVLAVSSILLPTCVTCKGSGCIARKRARGHISCPACGEYMLITHAHHRACRFKKCCAPATRLVGSIRPSQSYDGCCESCAEDFKAFLGDTFAGFLDWVPIKGL